MSFAIPAATSVTTLFVTKKDHYTSKKTGEVVANIQALSPVPVGSGNAEGYEVTEYRADASVLSHIDLKQGPVQIKFESQIRPITDGFGRTTNTQVLTKVINEQQQRQSASQQGKPSAVQAEAPKA